MNLPITSDLSLSEFRPSDRDALVEWLADRTIYEQTLRIPHPYTPADADKWLATVAAATERNGQPVQWAIRLTDGQLVGAIGLDDVQVSQSYRGELGYWLAKPYRGQGITPGAVSVACRHAFDTLGLSKVTAHVFARNTASARVLQKCGFQQEGYLRQHFLKDGELLDAKAFGLLRSERVQ